MSLTDSEFRLQFENCTLPPEGFDHRGHLRIAWIYLKQFPLEQAIEQLCNGISTYATSLGAKDKFHWTITEFTARLMIERLEERTAADFEQFIADNNDIAQDLLGLIANYYSEARLNGDKAKTQYVLPDRRPLTAPVTD